MQNWKKALIAGSAAGSAIMFLKKKPGAGVLLARASLVTVASEYPEQFTKVRRAMPDYFGRGCAWRSLHRGLENGSPNSPSAADGMFGTKSDLN